MNLTVLRRKYTFCAVWSKKIKIFYLRWNLLLKLIQMCWRWWNVYLSCFVHEIPILSKFAPKNKNFLFKMNLVSRLVRVLNSIVMFKFSLLYRKYPFLSNLVQKNQNYLFKLKFVFWIKFNMLNLMVMFNFLF